MEWTLFFLAVWTPHMRTMRKHSDLQADDFSFWDDYKAPLQQNLAKQLTFRYHPQNRKPSGDAMQRCKAHSSSSSWMKQKFSRKHLLNSMKIHSQWSTRRKEMSANPDSNISKPNITTSERWFLMAGANLLKSQHNKTRQTWQRRFSQQRRSQSSAKWSLDYKTRFITLFQLTDLSYLTIVDWSLHFVPLPFSNWGVCQISS